MLRDFNIFHCGNFFNENLSLKEKYLTKKKGFYHLC